jgi:hypothetical protein
VAGGLRLLGTVAASGLLSSVHAKGIATSANDLVANSWKIPNPTASNQNDRVFLKIVPFTGDVDRHFFRVAQPNPSDLAKRGVRLLGGHGSYKETNTLLLRAAFQNGTFGRFSLNDSIASNELIDGRHRSLMKGFPMLIGLTLRLNEVPKVGVEPTRP